MTRLTRGSSEIKAQNRESRIEPLQDFMQRRDVTAIDGGFHGSDSGIVCKKFLKVTSDSVTSRLAESANADSGIQWIFRPLMLFSEVVA